MTQLREAQGYSKEKALKSTGLEIELDRLKNATIAWKKAGSPINTKQLNVFLTNYIKDKKAPGAYIVLDAPSDDTRLRPYNVINETTTGKRKAKTMYQIKEAEFKVKYTTSVNEAGEEVKTPHVEVLSAGSVEVSVGKKETAFKTMKELIEENKKDYVVEIVREITEGQKYAGYGLYTPSKSAKVGKFVFAVPE